MMVALRWLGTAFGDDVYDENMYGLFIMYSTTWDMLPNVCDDEE